MPRARSAPETKTTKAMDRGKKPPTELALAISSRLRAVQAELDKTDDGMAELLSVGRSRWTNWVNAENMPEEGVMMTLCEATGLTMDWLYRGRPDGIVLGHAIRLTARIRGVNPDDATAAIFLP